MAAMPRRTLIAVFALAPGLAMFCGCSPSGPTTQPTSMTEQQQRALQDPYSYSPDARNSDMSVSGHGAFDKEGFNRDKDFVLDP